ncbi:hypothetical protein ADL25_12855 [Streptomyces sp. NRRL F-5122]|nr:hypothetical protein ADL25_12855 [Streptomyces sp. NRRL F-5122]
MSGDQVGLVQVPLEQPLRRWRPHLLGLPLPRLALPFLCDPSVDLGEGGRGLLDDDAVCEVQQVEFRRRGVVRVFDITA